MSVIPILRPKELFGILLKFGFEVIHHKGAHFTLQHPATRRITMIAMHTKALTRGKVAKVLRQAGIATGEFLRFLKKIR